MNEKSESMQIANNKLHTFGFLILFFILLQYPLAMHEAQKSAIYHRE